MNVWKFKAAIDPAAQFMPGFVPFAVLWQGASAPYPSENSARWVLRKLQPQLAAAGAVALHRNRLYVHPERFAAVAEQAAVNAFTARVESPRAPAMAIQGIADAMGAVGLESARPLKLQADGRLVRFRVAGDKPDRVDREVGDLITGSQVARLHVAHLHEASKPAHAHPAAPQASPAADVAPIAAKMRRV